MTYCQSDWVGCDPARYDVDGTIERLLAAGVEEIHMVDLTTSGVRFFKSWDVVNLARQVVERHNARTGTKVTVRWVNDPLDVMTQSYPAEPAGWTMSRGDPARDRSVPLERTGVLLVNHATRGNGWFDPKIDDTLVLNDNMRELLKRHPALREANIIGAWFGRRETNSSSRRLERTRDMRGENLGEAFLYETESLPTGWSAIFTGMRWRNSRRRVSRTSSSPSRRSWSIRYSVWSKYRTRSLRKSAGAVGRVLRSGILRPIQVLAIRSQITGAFGPTSNVRPPMA